MAVSGRETMSHAMQNILVVFVSAQISAVLCGSQEDSQDKALHC